MALSDAQIIRLLDRIEADLRGLEVTVYSLRSALRERIDPGKQRKDLGLWYDNNDKAAPREPVK